MSSNEVILLTGATASGKSAEAIRMAEEQKGIIINADSMQLYQGAPILTAQPTQEEQGHIEHRLYGILTPDDPCSVARWIRMACEEIHRCWSQGNLPIIVGGTGMYLKVLMEGIATIPDIDLEIRTSVRQLSADELHKALQKEDLVMAERLTFGDKQRMARALEVIRSTGISLSEWVNQPVQPPLPDVSFMLYAMEMPRAILYERINQRFDAMLASGALEEANMLHTQGYARDLPLMRAVGIAELLAFHDGDFTIDVAIEQAKMNSRRYAKRQLTWIRRQFPQATLIRNYTRDPE